MHTRMADVSHEMSNYSTFRYYPKVDEINVKHKIHTYKHLDGLIIAACISMFCSELENAVNIADAESFFVFQMAKTITM